MPPLRDASERSQINRQARKVKCIEDQVTEGPNSDRNPSRSNIHDSHEQFEADDDNAAVLVYNSLDSIHSIVGQGSLDHEISSQPPLQTMARSYFYPEILVVPHDETDEPAELVFTHQTSQYLDKSPKLADDHEISFQYNNDEPPVAVIQRVNNLITRDEALKHSHECKTAMIKELERWCKHKAWVRKSRKDCHNVLQSRWVLKWKNMKDGRGVKARLVVQGFMDRQHVDNYAATTSRWGQRLIIILPVQFGWPLISLDVSEAFLRGITFQELHEADPTQPLRQVQLKIPPGSGILFRSLTGMEDFCEETEVLEMRKPGFGLKDAPRLWNIALRKVLREIGVGPLSVDNQLYVKHDKQNRLILAISVHVDDLKLTGHPTEVKTAQDKLEEQLDEMKCEANDFEHLGLRHSKHADGSVSVDQIHYAKELKLIPESDLRLHPQDPVSPEVAKLYMSLL